MTLFRHGNKDAQGMAGITADGSGADGARPSHPSSARDPAAATTPVQSRKLKRAEALGVVLGLLIVIAVFAAFAFVVSRNSNRNEQAPYSSDWTTPTDASTNEGKATLDRVDATYQLDGMNGTADFGSAQTVSWSVGSLDGRTVLQYENSMGMPIKSFSVTYSLKSSASASDVRAALDSITGGFTGDIEDSELATWKVGCTGNAYSQSGASGETAACVLGGYQLTDVSQLSAFRPVSLALTAVDTDAGRIDDYSYSFASNSATLSTESTIGGWPADATSSRIPEPASQVYYNVRETDEGMAFSILDTGDGTAYDSYVSQCKGMGWTVESSENDSTSFASKDGYTLTVARNSGASSVDVLLLSDAAQSAEATATASASSGDASE